MTISQRIDRIAATVEFEDMMQSYLENYQATQDQIFNQMMISWPTIFNSGIEINVQIHSFDDYSVDLWK